MRVVTLGYAILSNASNHYGGQIFVGVLSWQLDPIMSIIDSGTWTNRDNQNLMISTCSGLLVIDQKCCWRGLRVVTSCYAVLSNTSKRSTIRITPYIYTYRIL